MSLRQYIYETLKNYPNLQPLVSDRVYQGESLDRTIPIKPFLVYRLGNDTDMQFADEDAHPHQQFFQVHAHDERPDYSRVDSMILYAKAAFRATPPDPSEGIIAIRYLETSRDLDDQVLGTITRYARFQFVMN